MGPLPLIGAHRDSIAGPERGLEPLTTVVHRTEAILAKGVLKGPLRSLIGGSQRTCLAKAIRPLKAPTVYTGMLLL